MTKFIREYLQWFYFLCFQLFLEFHRDKGRGINHFYDAKCTYALFGVANIGTISLFTIFILWCFDANLVNYLVCKKHYLFLFTLGVFILDEIFISPKFNDTMPFMEICKKKYNTWSTAKQIIMLFFPVLYTITVWTLTTIVCHHS